MNGHTCMQIQSCMHIKMTVFVLIMQSEASVQQSRFIYQLTLSSFIWSHLRIKALRRCIVIKVYFITKPWFLNDWAKHTTIFTNIAIFLLYWMHWLSETESVAMLKWPEVCSHGSFSFNFQSFMNAKETLDSVNFKSELQYGTAACFYSFSLWPLCAAWSG